MIEIARFAALPEFVWTLFAVFISVGFAFGVWFWMQIVNPVRRTLRQAILDVTHHDPDSTHLDDLSAIAEKRRAFTRAFTEIDESLRGHRLLRHGWNEFNETMVKPEDDAGEPYRNTVRPHAYLNLDVAIGAGYPPRWYPALPNWFIGVGLLLTFVGLLLALYAASTGVGADDIEKVKASLERLLGAATLKFLTSVAGILCSLGLSIQYRKGIQEIENGFDRLCEELEVRMLFVTPPEFIAQQQLKAFQEQSVQFERFNTDLAMAIDRSLRAALRETMPEILSDANRPVKESVDRMGDRMAETNVGALGDIAKRVVEGVQGAAGQEMRQLAETMRDIRGGLTSVIDRLDGTGSDFSQQIAAASQGLAATMSGIAEQIREISATMADNLANAQGKLDNQMVGAVARMELAATSMSERMGSVSEALERAISAAGDQFGEKMRAGTNAVEKGLEEASRKAREQLASAADGAASSLQGPVGALVEGLGALQATLTVAEQRISTQVGALDRIGRSAANVADSMDAAASAFAQSSEPLLKVSQDFSRTATSLRDSIAGASAAMEHAQRGGQELQERMQRIAAALETAWNDHRQRFEAVDGSLERVMRDLSESLEANGQGLMKFVGDVEKQTADAVGLLGTGIDELREIIEQLLRGLHPQA
jgi:methyl-accepting chemotaxis protein